MGADKPLPRRGSLVLPDGVRRWLAGLMLAAAALVGATAAASAHASLIRSTPVEGAVVGQMPAQIMLTFSEPVTPLVVLLMRPDGRSDRLEGVDSGDGVGVDLPATDMPDGTYLLSWRVVSSDGHPVGGTVTFSVGSASATAPAMPVAADERLRAALWAAKLALYLGFFFGAGSAFASCWLTPKTRHGAGAATAFTILGLVAAPVSFGLQGLDALGAPLGLFGQSLAWQAAAATSYGFTAAIAFIALALALLALVAEAGLARLMSLAALAGVGFAFAASGHASAAAPQWLARPMVFVHGVGIAFWLGALLPLGLSLRQTPDASEALRRFSATIPYVFAALIGAGIVLALIQVGSFAALWQTAYGELLMAKLALVTPLLLLAVVNRWRLTKPALAEQADAQRRLARNIAAEALLMVAILGVVAGFRFTPPPRVLAVEAAEPASIHIHTADAMAELSITPGHTGKVSASIVVMTGDFGPLDAESVVLRLGHLDAAEITASAYKPGDGTWRVDNIDLPMPGKWTVSIDIGISGAQRTSLAGDVTIRP
ncbi:copper resistance protein CopC [Aminobacter sp. AP02]|uniref:copper resistance CopC/CopD family protein n=1 Tax=Aminobacter sp. AP02 TaxID=2135737 RepID=UPI000D6B0D10|nr:copper resistance protein CopC [Aminobacter sp. AP02]PWK76142.1 copper transport protein [Aminobacter sp. AP02]